LEIRCRKVHNVVARSLFRNQNRESTTCPHRKSTCRCRTKCASNQTVKTTKVRTIFGDSNIASLKYIYYIILHRTSSRTTTLPTLHQTSPHPTKLNNITLQFTSPHCTTFHYTSLQEKKQHSATLQLQIHSTTLYYTTLH
jgi:hypothetical protein